jgi:hypothetical protein
LFIFGGKIKIYERLLVYFGPVKPLIIILIITLIAIGMCVIVKVDKYYGDVINNTLNLTFHGGKITILIIINNNMSKVENGKQG